MPVIHTYTSEPLSESQRTTIKARYGQIISRVPGKSEPWLMCLFQDDVPIYMGGNADFPTCYVTVDVFSREEPDHGVWSEITPEICDVISSVAHVEPSRIYIRYGWTPDFGWNGRNF